MPEITYAEALAPLEKILAQVERPGDYFAVGALETPMPFFEIDGVGLLSFPVPPEQCGRLIANAAERAPYGRGDQTLIDESVRKVWQIPTGKVHLRGKHWEQALSAILELSTAGLGCPPDSLDTEFYKMLVYDEGGFFLPHRDTEKVAGMVATLVVVLPSAHSGGNLIIRHNDRETTLDLSELNPAELHFAAFYADCEHEVQPITDGHRVCLIYNLIQKKSVPNGSLRAPDTRPVVEAAAAELRDWANGDQRADKLVHLLEHRYTEAALAFEGLKGRDSALAGILKEAAEKSDCALHLGLVHIEETGSADYNGAYYGRSHRYWAYDDEEEDEDEYEVGEICDVDRYIDQWRDIRDHPVEFGKIPLNDEEILPVGALDDEEADETHFSEATGNAGASFERTYLCGALVLWPRESFDTICASAGIDAALARLEQRIGEARSGDEEAVRAVGKIVRTAIESFLDHFWSKERLTRFITVLTQFGDLSLLKEHALPRLAAIYARTVNPALCRWAGLAGPEAFAPVLESLLESRKDASNAQPISWMELWCELTELWKGRKDAEGSLGYLFDRTLPYLRDDFLEEEESPSYHFRGFKEPEKCSPDLLVRFLKNLQTWPNAEDLEAFVILVSLNTERFPPDDLILPALENVAKGGPTLSADTTGKLWQHCAEYFLSRSSAPPSPPTDWTLPLTDRQMESLRGDIKDFALDPDKREMRFRVRNELRQQVHRIIESEKTRHDSRHGAAGPPLYAGLHEDTGPLRPELPPV